MKVISLCSIILGDIYTWLTQQDDRGVRDILPIKKHQNEQLSSGAPLLDAAGEIVAVNVGDGRHMGYEFGHGNHVNNIYVTWIMH